MAAAMSPVKVPNMIITKGPKQPVKSEKSILAKPESMEKPTKMRATPVTAVGTMRNRGERKMHTRNSAPVTMAVRPVRPPASTPMVDSMKVEMVVQPVPEPTTVPMASTRKGFSMWGKLPSLSSMLV